jgi:uncharacterized membrane protein YdjX (TVP38/TMEM64 family)
MLAQDTITGMQPTPPIKGKLVLVGLVALAIGAFFYFDLKTYLSLDNLKANRDSLLAFTEEHYVAAVILFILAYIVQTSLSLPGAAIMSLTGGLLFGSVLALMYVNLGATTGATLAFLGARYLFRDWVEQKFGHRLGALQEGFAKDAFSYLLTLRLIPLFPFFLVNVLSGLTRVNLGTYVAATALGIIPGSFVYTFAGRQLGTLNSLADLFSLRLLIAFTLFGLLFLMPVAYRKWMGRRNGES